MPMLFPPLVSTTSAVTVINKAAMMANFDDASLSEGDEVLSPELTHNFETLRILLAKPEVTSKENGENEVETLNNLNDGGKRRQAEELALATALVVEREVAFLQNGIGELEAMLAIASAQDGMPWQPDLAHRRHGFPALPPLVPDDEDDDYETLNHWASNKGDELVSDESIV